MTQKPCYQNGNSYECKYNEYNPNKDKDYLPYAIKNENNIFSLMKIDRSYGIPFIKGYIELLLDESSMKEILNEESNIVYYYLFLFSLNYKFSLSNLREGGTTISISGDLELKIKITFSTYNDLLNDVIQYILDLFKQPIDEVSFNTIKEIYILYYSENHDSSLIYEMLDEIYNLAIRFLTADTLEKSIINKESVKNSLYDTYSNFFNKIINIITNIKYLTHGDISFEQANETTNKLLELIKFTPKMKLKLSEKKIEIPEKSSFLYSYKSENKYQVQGGTHVLYEYDEKIEEEITIYYYCASSFFFDYIRTKRGSGYQVRTYLSTFNGKHYFEIITVGKVYSPEKMDRLINEAINASFTFDKCLVNEIEKYFNIKNNLPPFYAEEKFEELKTYLDNKLKINNLKDKKEINYETIVNTLKSTFVDKPKRVSILYHRGDITDEELKEQEKELDEHYYLNQEILNQRTEDIKYLENLSNKKIFNL